MVGMQIAEAQLLAKRAWHLQWAYSILTSLAFFAGVEVHRRAGVFGMSREFAIIWGSGAIILAAYMTEQTWHAWRQLQFARKLTRALTPSEFERAKAQEEWRSSLRYLLLFAAVAVVFAVIELTLPKSARPPFTAMLFLLFMPAAQAGRSWRTWRKLRRVSA
jgi:hypothetical protein